MAPALDMSWVSADERFPTIVDDTHMEGVEAELVEDPTPADDWQSMLERGRAKKAKRNPIDLFAERRS